MRLPMRFYGFHSMFSIRIIRKHFHFYIFCTFDSCVSLILLNFALAIRKVRKDILLIFLFRTCTSDQKRAKPNTQESRVL